MGLQNRINNSFFETQNLNQIKAGLESGKVLNTSLKLEKKTSKSTLIALSILTLGIYYFVHKATHDKTRIFKKLEAKLTQTLNTYLHDLKQPELDRRQRLRNMTLEDMGNYIEEPLKRQMLTEALQRMEGKNGADPFRFYSISQNSPEEQLAISKLEHECNNLLPQVKAEINRKLAEPTLNPQDKAHLLETKMKADRGTLKLVPCEISANKFKIGAMGFLGTLGEGTVTLTNGEVTEKIRQKLREPGPAASREINLQAQVNLMTQDTQALQRVTTSISTLADALWPDDDAKKVAANRELAELTQTFTLKEREALPRPPMNIF